MPVVLVAAGTTGAHWPWPTVVAWGGLAGAAAGTVLGAVTAPWLTRLGGAGPTALLPARARGYRRATDAGERR